MRDFAWKKYGPLIFLLCIAPTSAAADSTDLFCHEVGMNSDVGLYLSLDSSASTVAAWYSGVNRDSAIADHATITDDEVTWSSQSYSGEAAFTLDRNTGALNETAPNGSKRRFTCVKAGKVF